MGLGPCPIAGERPIAAIRANVVAQHDTAFIANLPSSRMVEHEPREAPAPQLSLTTEPSGAAVGTCATNNLLIPNDP
jgi:hypothetical protein